MEIDVGFFTHSAATIWLIVIIAVLFVALVAVELWLAGPRKLRRAWRDVKGFVGINDNEEQTDDQ